MRQVVGSSSVGGVRNLLDARREGAVGITIQAAQRYVADGMTERAPALAYYAVLSLFPALVVTFAVIRFIGGDHVPDDIASYAREHGVSGPLADTLRSAVRTAEQAPSPSAGTAGAIGAVTSIYGASRAFTATGRAFDVVGGREGRPRSLARRAQDIGWTLVLITIGLVAVALMALSGGVLRDVLGSLGISGAGVTIWAVLRWPLSAALLLVLVALVRWAAPTGGRPRFTPLSAGTVVTVAALVVGGAGFNAYVSVIADYDDMYGTFAGAIILMVYIWLAGGALLFGAEIDAVRDEDEEAAGADPPVAMTPRPDPARTVA